MVMRANMLHSGLSPLASREIVGNVLSGLVATGTVQGDALALVASNSYFTTVGAGAGSILRNDLGSGESQTVFNGGANALKVYPPVGGQVSNGGANVAFSVGVNKVAEFYCIDNLNFAANLSA